ncbi:MAG TPA: cytochrome c biogenesis protein CcsA [Candidatus Thalassarchaeaceae archaeon]|nr:cytochrome c biogenesis protein CcsA [Candidatus Thalassarchaeaceae archaeon]
MRRFLGILLMLPFTILLFLFLIDASSIEYVWNNGGSELPFFYRISAIWAGREGPLLLWVAMLGALLLIDGGQHTSETDSQHQFRLRLLIGFSTLLLLIALMLNPFRATPSDAITRPGLNALLQTDLMVIHPPVIFAFYTLCVGVGVHAVSAMLFAGAPARDRILHLARPALWVGTLGVGLGGLWAYTVLDWGGYWAWDPVETGSLLPWISLILLLHFRLPKGMVNEDHWFVGLGILPAFFAIHATLVTRANGVWDSVHAFVAEGEIDPSMGPIQRILELGFSDSAGIEVHLYLLILFCLMWLGCRHFANSEEQEWSPLVIIAGALLGSWIGTLEVGILTGVFAFLLWNQSATKERVVWMTAGVMLMLFSYWAFLLEMIPAIIGMIGFLSPMLLWGDQEDPQLNLNDGRWQQRVAVWVPLAIGAPFLLLTWLLLLAEVDGTNLAWHEIFGLPLLCMAALGLTVYSWRKVVEPHLIPRLVGGVIVLSILFSALMGDSLPGDSDHLFSEGISRGMIAGFALPLLIFSVPPMVRLVWTRYGEFQQRRKPLQLRRLAIHIAHLGILLLLVGHVFTTTLVQRGDPSHIVMLAKDAPIEHGEYWYTFTELTVTSLDDEGWEGDVGDGKIIVTVEVRKEADGEVIATMTPGMLRFDREIEIGDSTISLTPDTRSEIDIWHRPHGDLVMIFDQSQAQTLGDSMDTGEPVDRVRVVIYDLTGSHLVWAGWSLILIGTALNWIMAPPIPKEEEE